MCKQTAVPVPSFRHMAGGIGKTLAYQYIRAGEVDIIRLGRRTLVTVESIERLLERNTVRRAD